MMFAEQIKYVYYFGNLHTRTQNHGLEGSQIETRSRDNNPALEERTLVVQITNRSHLQNVGQSWKQLFNREVLYCAQSLILVVQFTKSSHAQNVGWSWRQLFNRVFLCCAQSLIVQFTKRGHLHNFCQSWRRLFNREVLYCADSPIPADACALGIHPCQLTSNLLFIQIS